MLTAEELEKKKKREAELMWKKILAYYMMETYVTKAQARAEAELRNAYLATNRYVKEHGLLNRLAYSCAGVEQQGDPVAREYGTSQKQRRGAALNRRQIPRAGGAFCQRVHVALIRTTEGDQHERDYTGR